MTTKRKIGIVKKVLLLLVLIALPLLSNNLSRIIPKAMASGPMIIINMSDTMSTSAAATAANHTFTWTTSNATQVPGTSDFIVNFPSAWTGLNTITAADVEIKNTTTSYVWPITSASSSGTSGLHIVLNSPTAPSANDVMTLKIGTNVTGGTHQITSPAAGTYVIYFSSSYISTANPNSVAVVFSANTVVGVSANVDPTLAFTMTPTTLLFGSLTATSVRYADSTGGLTTIPAQAATPLLTASTNGVSGVLISVYDTGNGTNGGLYSSTVSDLIPAAAVNGLVAGNKKFGVTGLSGSSLTATAGFNGTGAGGTGVISTTPQSFASSAGPVGSGNIAMIMVASIDALTHAGAYSDTVTVVCTGRF